MARLYTKRVSDILIIGAQGMLGSMLSTVFADRVPILWDRAEIDITKRDEVQQKIKALQPKFIINAAAYTDVDGAETNKEVAFAVNSDAVRYLAEVAKELDATLIHYSTDYIFPGTNKEGYKESDVPGPAVNVYGESKLAGEKAIQEIGCRFYILRTAWLYGPNGKNFVDTMLKLAEDKKDIQVVNDQFGSPTFTKDVAQTTRFWVDGINEPGIYHAVNQGITNWAEFAQTVFKFTQKNVNVIPVPSSTYSRPAKRPQYSVLLNTRGPKLRAWQNALHEYLGSVDRRTYLI